MKMASNQIPAPVKGLNLRQNTSKMGPEDALILKNYICDETDIRVRGGTDRFGQGIGATVGSIGVPMQTLMEWAGPAGRKFFAAGPAAIFDITSGGAGTTVVTSLTAGYWSHLMFTTAGGSFLVAANGANDVRNYDGTTWTTPSITNVTSATLNFVASHMSRLWFVQNDTTKAWYLPTSAIAGAAAGFELGERFTKGGKLMMIGALSRDSGSGVDDVLCFISSKGEVAVYSGTDPASADTWALVGRYSCAAPINNRSLISIGGDLGIVTQSALVSVRALIAGGQEKAEADAISDKIDHGIARAYQSYGTLAGWQIQNVSSLALAYLNIPLTTSTAFQYCLNTTSGSWSELRGMHATCWGIYNDQVYYGTYEGDVYRAETGYSDYGSVPIEAEVKPAFRNFGTSHTKRFTRVRPIFAARGRVVPAIRVATDYKSAPPVASDQFPHDSLTGSFWSYGRWSEARWGGRADALSATWLTATGRGKVATVHMKSSTIIRARLNAIDIQYEVVEGVTT